MVIAWVIVISQKFPNLGARYETVHFRSETNWIFITICHLVVALLFPCLNKLCSVSKLKTESNISLWRYDANFVSLMSWCICWEILYLYVFSNAIVLIQMLFGVCFSIMDCRLNLNQCSGVSWVYSPSCLVVSNLSIAESQSEKDPVF